MKKIHFERIDSTSSYLKKNYDNYDNLTFVSADYQESGHGRSGRRWYSEDGENLLFSILIKDKRLLAKVSNLSLASAVCVYNILKRCSIDNVSIKWPNDVYVKDNKISGILLESVSCGKGVEALIIGVGINVNSKSFREDFINKPTSMCFETNESISLEDLKSVVYDEFINMFDLIIKEDFSYLDVVRNNNYLKGKMVYALVNNEIELVEVIDVNEDNSLKVKVDSKYLDVCSGEITFHV